MELKCLGIALKALMDAKMYDAAEAAINAMAEEEKPDSKKKENPM
jgi:hypothetical protein